MRRFVRSILVAVSLFSVPVFAEADPQPAPKAAPETLTVRAGSSKTLELVGLTRLALGNPDVADASVVGGGDVRIDGLKAGETTLLVWTASGRKEYRIVVK
ncbi:pilus assembly protein N-terminal domain-containing protein [Hyalangium versicolor]|uniref:pilus assembly protein N-terminal domain-containing protein n=1 Tax=Hyalangium versicolor TaxID=2861190 RepID=UPI001CD00E1D|nr:pilus assembly protein N-terminal domain-containing protein [Hyalangium versicolor]